MNCYEGQQWRRHLRSAALGLTSTKSDTLALDRAQLRRLRSMEYGIGPSDLQFLPKGGDAYVYVATLNESGKYFVRVQEALTTGHCK